MEKKLILVTSPPACGKTYVAKALAKNLKHVVYLDKDTLIVLSKQIFKVAGQPYDRSSAFFQQNIRDYEYDCVLALAMEALDYDDIVLINAPFTQEVRDNAFIADLKAKLAAKGWDYDGMASQLAEAYRKAALDNRALLADVGGRFYRWPDPRELYAADGVHPSELGSRMAAETIADVIRHHKEAE